MELRFRDDPIEPEPLKAGAGLFYLPHPRNDCFVGRDGLMEELRESFSSADSNNSSSKFAA